MDAPNHTDRGTILVVDDDPNVCELVALYLSQDGFKVECVHDGAEALSKARKDPPDLIVLDLMLPSVDGLEVCRQLRNEQETPIIMLTARATISTGSSGWRWAPTTTCPSPSTPESWRPG